jgi:hypothetical protein
VTCPQCGARIDDPDLHAEFHADFHAVLVALADLKEKRDSTVVRRMVWSAGGFYGDS